MNQAIYFTFNQPRLEILIYYIILLGLIIPVWKICKVKNTSGSILHFLFSLTGWPYVTVILLGFLFAFLLAFRDYRGFWTLKIVDENKVELGYWFPRSDPVIQPEDVSELRFVTIHYRSKGKIVDKRWRITLTTHMAKVYSSVNILSEEKVKNVITALEQWTGLHHKPYLREGMFGTLAPVAQ